MEVKRLMYFVKRTLWFMLSIVLFILVSNLCHKTLYLIAGRMTNEVSEDVLRAIHILLSLLAYHSFIYAAIFYDKELRANVEVFTVKRCFTATEPMITLLISALAFATFPTAFSVKMLSGWIEKSVPFSMLIMGVAFILIHYATWFECILKWGKYNSRKDKYGVWQTVKHFISACLAYPMLAYLLPIFFPTFRTFPAVAKVLITGLLPLIVILLTVMITVPIIRALFIRIRFIQKLKKAALQNGYKLSDIKHPYSSLFTDHDGSNFNVKANGKVYSVKLLAGNVYSNPMYLHEDGKGTISASLRFRMFLYGARGLGRIGWHNSDELARFETHFTYGFKGDGKKVLIICPTPHTIYATGGGENRLLDVADVIWGYTLMTGSSFINALERDSI